ncbi:ankyrin [Cucurbitaria berberidis CBS 394.84]|uniref:Ankyrin n=1 Tax=Cucurbitaria berberidis CBS 394.84 TaxID=1168544 RepID=A0A9P4GJQ4_9PLEO|nr:ankyrin [Cucurbitaria berberidis CBS 394.84]KAF1846370.1 ankyrin [Cucurbitaria berberidis CBS 394.84]
MPRRLRREDYTVGWVCALPVELAAAQEMLDEEHDDLGREYNDNNENVYALGSIAGHNVVIACLPAGRVGNNPAAAVATQMRATFKGIRFGLMVGIGAGVPTPEADIRLGDVVVSQPYQTFAGVVQYDFGKTTPSGFERTGSLNSPPQILLAAVARVRAHELRGKRRFLEYASKLERIPKFQRSKTGPDILFEAGYNHEGGPTCELCNPNRQKARAQRESEENVVVHYGTIASGNQVMRDAAERDRVSAELGGVLCFEMEAAGLMNSFQCLVIRGICDYADSHKNKKWQPYAAGIAAAYAKELLSVLPAAEVADTSPVDEAMSGVSEHDFEYCANPSAKRRKIDASNGFETEFTSTSGSQTKLVARRMYCKVPSDMKKLGSDATVSAQLSDQEQEQEYRHDDIHTAKDTCDWLLQHPHFRVWLKSTQRVLWIKGNPGAGKSVLMKYAVRKMHENQSGELILSFFVHGQDYLAQLTTKFEEREKRFGGYMADRWKWTTKELQDFLTTVLTKGTQSCPVIVFIDAIDECGEVAAKSLLAYFKEVAKQAKAEGARFKVCLSSRHYPILGLETIPAINVEDENGKDVQWYTRKRLEDIQLKGKRQQIEDEILLKARGGFQWVFLVTEKIIGRNLAGIRADKLLDELTVCPETLSELYAALLSSVTKTEKLQMTKLFQWVLFAERPLSTQELREALAADADMSCTSISQLRDHESWSESLDGFERHVKHISRGLVQFQTREVYEQYEPNEEDPDREAQLIHQSVADYLFDKFLYDMADNQHAPQSPAGAGHFQISRSCLRYLTLRELLEAARLPRGTVSSQFPLAPYATRYLFDHIRKVEKERILQPDLLTIIQWTPQSRTMQQLADLLRVLDPDSAHTPLGWPFCGATAFHVLAAFGSNSACDGYLNESDETIDGKDSDMNTPLHIAIREGCQDIALTLLDQSIVWQSQHGDNSINEGKCKRHKESRLVDIEAENNDGDTALTIALSMKADKVLSKLIEAGADLKYMGREMALVAYAISNRNMRLLARLIGKNICLDGAVFFAVKDHHLNQDDVLKEIVAQLLKAGANTIESPMFGGLSEPKDNSEGYDEDSDEYFDEYFNEFESRNDDNALLIACRRGQADLVDLLLSYGASATCQNKIGESPLLIAADCGHNKLTQSLLQCAPSAVELETGDGRTALDAVIDNNEIDLLLLLIKKGSFSTSNSVLEKCFMSLVDDEYTLRIAVEAFLENDVIESDVKNQILVKYLLNCFKGNFYQGDGGGQSPLLWAARNGYKEVVKLLLEVANVDVNAQDRFEQSPILCAAAYEHQEIVRLLLHTGKVSIDARSNSGWALRSWAVVRGYGDIVKLLHDTSNINVNADDNTGPSLLWWAARTGCVAMIELLSGAGEVDIDVWDDNGRTALSWAAQYGHTAVVQLLIKTNKVNIHANDHYGQSPRWWAARNGNDAVVKLLDEASADRDH